MSSLAAEEITLRAGDDADAPAVLELMKLSLGEGTVPRTAEFWHWKHRTNPFGASPMWLAQAGGRLVGVRLFLRWRLRAGAQEYAALRAVDTATHPDYQGKGIFKKLTNRLVDAERAAGAQLIFNTPNDKSRPGYLKMGWSAVGRLSLWIRPLSPLRLLLAALGAHEPARDDSNDAAALRPDAFSRFSDAPGSIKHDGYRTPLSRAYLEWRYRPPGIGYAIESEGDAALVFRVRRRGPLRELRICDLLLSGNLPIDFRTVRHCIARATERWRPDYLVAALRPELRELGLAAALGFVPAPRIGPVLTVRPLALPPAAPDPRRLLNWSTSIGDLELF